MVRYRAFFILVYRSTHNGLFRRSELRHKCKVPLQGQKQEQSGEGTKDVDLSIVE